VGRSVATLSTIARITVQTSVSVSGGLRYVI